MKHALSTLTLLACALTPALAADVVYTATTRSWSVLQYSSSNNTTIEQSSGGSNQLTGGWTGSNGGFDFYVRHASTNTTDFINVDLSTRLYRDPPQQNQGDPYIDTYGSASFTSTFDVLTTIPHPVFESTSPAGILVQRLSPNPASWSLNSAFMTLPDFTPGTYRFEADAGSGIRNQGTLYLPSPSALALALPALLLSSRRRRA